MKEEFDFYTQTAIKSYNLDSTIRYQLSMLNGLDNFTRLHSENVANITCRLCQYLKEDDGFTVYTTTCAYLHDLGKMFIPSSILQKPGKLTDEEYEIMKTHTTIGYNMCMKDLKLRPYAAGPLYHHEALNGTGYPNKLTEKDIPYEGQIIRVADEYDAITAKRQYKTHIGTVETLKILIENANNGKTNKKILRQLFKVIADDTENEIYVRSTYLDFVKDELKRLYKAEKYYNKYLSSKKESDKEYNKAGVEMYLNKPLETIDNFMNIKQDYESSLSQRQENIKKLQLELKEIKKLRV